MSSPDDRQSTEAGAPVPGDVTGTGVFQVVLDGYDAVYEALPRGETFNPDPSAAGLSAARARARAVGLADRSRFLQGTFEQTNLPGGAAGAVMSVDAFQYAPGKRAALAEFFRILRPGGRVAVIAFEVDPVKVAGVPVLGADPVPDYVPLLEAAGFGVEAYEEIPGWRERVNAAFNAVVDASDTLTAEMGEAAAAAVVAEAMLTVQIQPYPRRVLVVARRPD